MDKIQEIMERFSFPLLQIERPTPRRGCPGRIYLVVPTDISRLDGLIDQLRIIGSKRLHRKPIEFR